MDSRTKDALTSWQEIRFFESHPVLEQFAADRLGFKLPRHQSDEILACFQLARDYYDISREASITVKPLPLFYGMSNLVKALVLLCGGKERNSLARLARGHGLKLQGDGKNLEGMACQIGASGTFCEFLDTFRCDIPFHFPQVFDARLRSAGAADLHKNIFRLRDLLGWFPALRALYQQTFDEAQPIVRVMISRSPMGGHHTLRFPDGLVEKELHKEFPAGSSFEAEQHFVRKANVTTRIVTSTLPNRWRDWIEMADGGRTWPFEIDVLVERECATTRHMATWMAEYAATFVCSGVVRYHPELWIGMIGRKRDSKVLALVEAFVAFAEADFPRRVLEMLKRGTLVKGYLTTLDELLVGSLG